VSRLLDAEGHQVTVIDSNWAALKRLGPEFKGRTITGGGFDRDVLLRAGIEQAEAFAAASSSDSVNIVAARVARNIFHVPRVVARLYEPRRAEVYRKLGLVTFSSSTWGAERLRELLTHSALDPVLSLGSGEVSVITVEAPPHLVGRTVHDLTAPGEIGVMALTREGRALIPLFGTQFRAGDLIHVVVAAGAMARLEGWLGLAEGG
jgi:trk system potassium uptake protein TrkA